MKPYADHFSQLAGAYAECRPCYPEGLFDYLAGLVGRHDMAWDCAAGNGQATVSLSRIFHRVVATDISAAMLARAPRGSGIEYRVAPAEASGLEAATVDLVTVAQALHWLDLEEFYREVKRVLVPGGVLAVWTYGCQQLGDADLDAPLQRFYAQTVGPYWPGERRHVESGYRTLPFPFKEIEPPAFDLREDWTLDQLLGYIGTWSATARFREVQNYDPVTRLAEELADSWGDRTAKRSIRWPLRLRAGYNLCES